MKPNYEIRKMLKDNNIYLWQVARKLNIHEQTLYSWLRYEPLPEEHRELIVNAVSEINSEVDHGEASV